jgi:putative ABC transport system substrate-binding protein
LATPQDCPCASSAEANESAATAAPSSPRTAKATMNRRAFLCGSVLALGAPLAAEAQPTAKAPTVGWLSDGVRAGSQPGLQEAFLQGLRELGYVEGQTVVIERRDAAEKIERLDKLAAELVSYGVNVIVATSGAAALAAKRATTSIPIVIAESGDPVAIGLVASLGRPGGNVTGLSVMDQEITAKRVQLLKEIAPRVSQIAVLYHPPFPATLLTVSEARTAATRLGLAVIPMEVLTPDAFESAFNAVIRQRADACSRREIRSATGISEESLISPQNTGCQQRTSCVTPRNLEA